MRGFPFISCLSLIVCVQVRAQVVPDTTEDILRKGGNVSSNIQTAVSEHLALDHSFKLTKQLPELKSDLPPLLFYKDESWIFDWTPGQQARFIMEDIRQGLHALQGAEKPTGFDIVAL